MKTLLYKAFRVICSLAKIAIAIISLPITIAKEIANIIDIISEHTSKKRT